MAWAVSICGVGACRYLRYDSLQFHAFSFVSIPESELGGHKSISMRLQNLFLLALVGAFSFTTISCTKIQGCMDADSVNYDEYAEEDDGSCEYEGSILFWYGQDVTDELILMGVGSLTFKVDGAVVGSQGANVYWSGSSSPDCDAEGTTTVTRELGDVKNVTKEYEVTDEFGDVLWDGIINFEANTCTKLELTI